MLEPDEPPWIRPRKEGLLGKWHMPAGELRGGVLTACDRPFPADEQLEKRMVRQIPVVERCSVCQDVETARAR